MMLSVVFSFLNEANVLDELINRTRNAICSINIDYELIFVNDNSTDNSYEILLKNRKEDQKIKIINMSRRFGVHPCQFAGLKYAKGDAVIYMDSDLQDPPELIPEMVKKFENGADVVNMTRTERLGESTLKMIITKFAYQMINFVSDIDLPENTGDFKLLSRRVVDELIKLKEYDPYMRGLVHWIGFKHDYIYYKREPRFAGETHFSIFGTGPIKEFTRGIATFSAIPLYLSLFLGFLVSLGAFIYLIIIILTKFIGINLPGWSAIMATMLFLGGTILFTNGVMGIYIGRLYNDVKGRPSFIIKDTIGLEDG